ncbi:hypothetical protein HDV00_003620 [Rhizophlyctis rosea]|nr:hypothetical protein HDV00_003620 [Rhizophlyctis rosea]
MPPPPPKTPHMITYLSTLPRRLTPHLRTLQTRYLRPRLTTLLTHPKYKSLLRRIPTLSSLSQNPILRRLQTTLTDRAAPIYDSLERNWPHIQHGLAKGALKATRSAERGLRAGIEGEKRLRRGFEGFMVRWSNRVNPTGEEPSRSPSWGKEGEEAVNPYIRKVEERLKREGGGRGVEVDSMGRTTASTAVQSTQSTQSKSSQFLTRIRTFLPTLSIPFLSSSSSASSTTPSSLPRRTLRTILSIALAAIFLYGLGSAIPHAVTKYFLGRSRDDYNERVRELERRLEEEREFRRRGDGGWRRFSGGGEGESGEGGKSGEEVVDRVSVVGAGAE